VRCFAGGYNYLHVEKPVSPRKPLAELSSASDYVSAFTFLGHYTVCFMCQHTVKTAVFLFLMTVTLLPCIVHVVLWLIMLRQVMLISVTVTS